MKKSNLIVNSWRRFLYSYAEQHDWILLFLYETDCLDDYLIIYRKDLYMNYLRDLVALNGNTERLETIETDNDMVDICKRYQDRFHSKIEWEQLMAGIFHNEKLGFINLMTLPGTVLMRQVTEVKMTTAGENEAKRLMVWDKKSTTKKVSDLLSLHSGFSIILSGIALIFSLIALIK